MPTISQALLDAINKAEADLASAREADASHDTATAATNTAHMAELAAGDAASAAHQTANASSQAALTLLKTELQIP